SIPIQLLFFSPFVYVLLIINQHYPIHMLTVLVQSGLTVLLLYYNPYYVVPFYLLSFFLINFHASCIICKSSSSSFCLSIDRLVLVFLSFSNNCFFVLSSHLK